MQPARWWSRWNCACNLCRAVAGPPCWETFDDGQYASVHGCDSLPAHGSGKSYAGHGRGGGGFLRDAGAYQGGRSEEHTSELQSLMRISYAVFCLKKKKNTMT